MKTHINGNTIEQLMTNVVTLTQSQYDLLPLEQKNHGTYIISDSVSPAISADHISYGNSTVKDVLEAPLSMSNIDLSRFTVDSGEKYLCQSDGYFMLQGTNSQLATGRIYTKNGLGWTYFQANWPVLVYVKKGSLLCGQDFYMMRFVQFGY